MPASIFDTSRMLRLPVSRNQLSPPDSPGYEYDRLGHHPKGRAASKARLLRIVHGVTGLSIGWRELGVAAGIAVVVVVVFRWFIETHVQIAFYQRGWISQLLPERPPPPSSRCFSSDYLAKPWEPTSRSFPSSPNYNLSLGTLGLHPKVLSLSPGFDLPHHDDCYAFSRTLPTSPTPSMASSLPAFETTIIHLYWRSDLAPLGERQIVTIKSILATQDFSPFPGLSENQVAEAGDVKTHVVLWTNPSSTTDRVLSSPLLAPLLARFPDRISTRVLDIQKLATGTAMDGHALLDDVFDTKAWLDGDLVRILVLWQYGGIWVDMDDIVTRDLRVLQEHEWIVMWDCYDKPYEPLNGHMMHFRRESPYLCEMLSLMSLPPAPRPASTDWGQHLYHRLYRTLVHSSITPFKVLPYCLTDGRSCNLRDRLPDPFATVKEEQGWKWGKEQWREVERRVKGVFAVHLHNQWEKGFAEDGWVRRILVDEWDRKLGA